MSTIASSLEKREITVEQSPLDFKKMEDDDDGDKREPTLSSKENNSREKTEEESVKLTICEQHREKYNSNSNRSFKLLIDDLILSCSPFIRYNIPYLLVDNPADQLKAYLPQSFTDYFKSSILLQDTPFTISHLPSQHQNRHSSTEASCLTNNDVNIANNNNNNNMHEFLLMHLTKSFDNVEIKKMYADYKSRGGIAADLNKKRLILNNVEINDSNKNSKNTCSDDSKKPKYDCLDIYTR